LSEKTIEGVQIKNSFSSFEDFESDFENLSLFLCFNEFYSYVKFFNS